MTHELARVIDKVYKFGQLVMMAGALLTAVSYAGQRSERDEAQTRAIERMATEMQKMQEAANQGNAEIRVINVRVGALEDRVGKMERR
jgi:hypothetical protein